mmetsp:Transcript_22464/g.63785  ORF Transcript_22464/g.63785 Transcript_22464/m.63785 type:complete len:291 (-) Transcript_22464:236-1108(-)
MEVVGVVGDDAVLVLDGLLQLLLLRGQAAQVLAPLPDLRLHGALLPELDLELRLELLEGLLQLVDGLVLRLERLRDLRELLVQDVLELLELVHLQLVVLDLLLLVVERGLAVLGLGLEAAQAALVVLDVLLHGPDEDRGVLLLPLQAFLLLCHQVVAFLQRVLLLLELDLDLLLLFQHCVALQLHLRDFVIVLHTICLQQALEAVAGKGHEVLVLLDGEVLLHELSRELCLGLLLLPLQLLLGLLLRLLDLRQQLLAPLLQGLVAVRLMVHLLLIEMVQLAVCLQVSLLH